MQFLYDSGDAAVFMDTGDYEQLELPKAVAGDAMRLGAARTTRSTSSSSTSARRGVQVPSAVEHGGDQDRPGLKGDTASGGGTKPATLESGVAVQVPLFVNEGDRVRVDTRTRRVRLARLGRGRSAMRRSDQRRDAAFALYQREVTGRPLDELLDGREAVHARARRRAPSEHLAELDAEIGRLSQGLVARADRAARALDHAGGALRDAPPDDIPAEVAIDEAVSSRRSTAAPRRRGSSTASSAPPCASGGRQRVSEASAATSSPERLRAIAARLARARGARRGGRGAGPEAADARRGGRRTRSSARLARAVRGDARSVSAYPDDLARARRGLPGDAPLHGRRAHRRASTRRCATRCSPAASASGRS